MYYRELPVATLINRLLYTGELQQAFRNGGTTIQFTKAENDITKQMLHAYLNNTSEQMSKLSNAMILYPDDKPLPTKVNLMILKTFIDFLKLGWNTEKFTVSSGGTFYRGVKMNPEDRGALLSGATKAFTSISSDPNVAHKFATQEGSRNVSEGFIIEYKIDPGIKLLELNRVNPPNGKYNFYGFLGEFIMPPGLKLQATGSPRNPYKMGNIKVGTNEYKKTINNLVVNRKNGNPAVPVYTVHVSKPGA